MNTKLKLNVIVLLTIVAMVFGVFAANNHVVDNQTKKLVDGKVYSVKTHYLQTSATAPSTDTLATTVKNIYGPYNVAPDGLNPATTFTLQADIITGTTPTMSFDYQVTDKKEVSDTSAVWTAVDTLGTAAQNSTHTITGAGRYIWFQVNNYDATTCEIPGLIRVLIPTSTSVYKVVK